MVYVRQEQIRPWILGLHTEHVVLTGRSQIRRFGRVLVIVELQFVENIVTWWIACISFQDPKSGSRCVINRVRLVPLGSRWEHDFAYLQAIAEPGLARGTHPGSIVMTRIRGCSRLPYAMTIQLVRSIPQILEDLVNLKDEWWLERWFSKRHVFEPMQLTTELGELPAIVRLRAFPCSVPYMNGVVCVALFRMRLLYSNPLWSPHFDTPLSFSSPCGSAIYCLQDDSSQSQRSDDELPNDNSAGWGLSNSFGAASDKLEMLSNRHGAGSCIGYSKRIRRPWVISPVFPTPLWAVSSTRR